jgi:hypothetical protein
VQTGHGREVEHPSGDHRGDRGLEQVIAAALTRIRSDFGGVGIGALGEVAAAWIARVLALLLPRTDPS